MNSIFIATRNKGKVNDFQKLFSSYQIEVKSLLDNRDLPDVEETGSTFEENAALKAETIAARLQTPVLADDSGLMVDALDGRPGIYSARYAGEEKSDLENLKKVLQELEGVPDEARTARFVCVLAVAIPNQQTLFKKGFCEGKIAKHPKGDNGFGYDPIFIPNGYNTTMAELSQEEKNKISHRHQALLQLNSWLKEL